MKPKPIPPIPKPPTAPEASSDRKATSSSNLAAKIVNANTSASATSAANSSHVRKASENSRIQLGFLHTELRAQKRFEFEQSMKEKERLAAQQRLMYEQERQRQEQELIQRLRSTTTFKSQPIKHYKPVEVKPSEKPLTSPKAPQFRPTHGNSFRKEAD